MKRFVKNSVIFAGLVAGMTAVWADDADKLRELEKAIATPSTEAAPKRQIRSRAIVIDQAPEESQSAPQPSTASYDCQALPGDVKAVAVDFAIQFDVGSARISSTSTSTLNEIAKILALSPNRCIMVEGHTDITGDAERNMTLSRDRANSVVDYVTQVKGLDRKNFTAIGKGSTDPLKNLNPRDPKNRRVVFKVVVN